MDVTPGRQLSRDEGVDGGVLARISLHLVNPVLTGKVHNHVRLQGVKQMVSHGLVGKVEARVEKVRLFAEEVSFDVGRHGEGHVLADYAGGAKDGNFH